MNTSAYKKASYASRQLRGGPAPLASFEDLPSDEMESPNSLAGNATSDSESLNERLNDSSTPGTVLCSPISALRLDITNDQSDGASQYTLTPCLSFDGFRDEAARSVTPTYLETPQTKGTLSVTCESTSTSFLSVQEEKSPIEVRRKSSWTDLFHRPRSRSRSPQSSPQPPRKLSAQEGTEQQPPEEGIKKKKGILSSIFKFHDKKSSKAAKAESQMKSPPVEAQEVVRTREPRSKVPEKVFTLASPPPPPRPSVEVSIAVTDFHSPVNVPNEKLEQHPMSLLSDLTIVSDLTNEKVEDESSESDLATEITIEKEEEIDFEAETLLAQDSVDYDEFFAIEGSSELLPRESLSQQQKKPRRQRLEITTVPLERPRSTTPISVAPLEAFIQSSLHTPSPEVEKLRVLLPGEAFCGSRPKSPKKSQPKSWQDFCHAGLRSPRLSKRNDEDDDDISPDGDSQRKDSWTPSKECWETFEIPHDVETPVKDMKLSTSSSFSSSCDSNSADSINQENHFPEAFATFHSNEKLHICTDTNFASQELSRLKEPSDKSPL